MTAFKAYRIFDEDGKVASRFVDMKPDELDPGEVVIKVAYSSVNFKDALAATGAGKIIRRFPCNGGIDLSGTVQESADPRFKPGDEVIATSYDIGVSRDGGYAELCRVPADWVVPMPAGLDLFSSMALGTAGFTAGLAVVRMEHEGLKPENGPVIVTGATGYPCCEWLSRGGFDRQGSAKRLPENTGGVRSDAALESGSVENPATGQGNLGRCGGQPRWRCAGVDCQHHESRGRAGVDWPGRQSRVQDNGNAVYSARRQPGRR
jgi:hypothetical protein